jgi:glycosyltransferase involved in cell wall biosynthesis
LEKHLHIISLDVPYPVSYGGVYDLFYKLPVLKQQGVKIHLHCFYKHPNEQPELNKYCEEVFYYKRNTGTKGLATELPYIVASRINEELIQRLLLNDHPVLMEGIHCTAILYDERFNSRKLFVRLHNSENEYYRQLYHFSKKIKNAIFYWIESKKLYKLEKKLCKTATSFWAVAKQDIEYYKQEFNCDNAEYLPLFIPEWEMNALQGMGTYCLYHGNLEVEENQFAVLWLLQQVFKNLEIPFIIAGKNPSKKITSLAKKYKHISVIANPDDQQMQHLISKAHIHVLPSFNTTGIKIKLLNALYNGRHCVVNDAMIAGTCLTELCHIVNTSNEFKERIQLLYHQPFTTEEKVFRKSVLQKEFCNEINAKKIVDWIWG